MARRLNSVLASTVGTLCCVQACGGEAALQEPQQGEGTESPSNAAGPEDEAEPEDAQAPDFADDPFAVANQAPGYVPFEYPAGPYGLTRGQRLDNLQFLGWSAPLAAGYRLESAGPVQLSDFYDPRGEKGIELLLINAVAVWCGVCRAEYQDLQSNALYAQLRPRGLEILGVLFEDNDGAPARYADLVNWASSYAVEFPMVLDPAFKTGVYFDRSATPMNMLVDARTMQILELVTGYDPALYTLADTLLTERGR
jgi:hypothetical protein